MRLFIAIFAAAPALLLFAAGSGFAGQEAGAWNTNWEAARAQAKQAKKPLFVVFR